MIEEKKRFITALIIPVFLLVSIWLVWVAGLMFDLDLVKLGIYPRRLSGLVGIVTSPFIHGSWQHLLNNSLPLLFLTTAVFYFYRGISVQVFIYTFLMVGLWVWVGGRPAYHIGASGLIYGFASFLFLSGIIKRITELIALSLLVAFLYGSMIWYVFPIKEEMSWESHLMGALAGMVLAVFYRNRGPGRIMPDWEEEEQDEQDDNDDQNDWYQYTNSTFR